jgi:hypothetical protein
MVDIGYYWDKVMITQVVYLLKEYEDLLPWIFYEMKGIIGLLGAINVQLKPNNKPVKRRLYRLNPRYKAKVCKNLDQMLDAGIIFPRQEFE